jgi:hypothetical protein
MSAVLFLDLVPAKGLPPVVQALRPVVPSTYTTDALSEAFARHPDPRTIVADLAVCAVVAIISLALAARACARPSAGDQGCLDGGVSTPAGPLAPPDSLPDNGPQRSWRRDVAFGAVIVVILEAAAFPVGLLWGHVAPHTLYSVGGHQLNLVVGDAKPLVKADGWFLLITGVAGIIAGVLAYLLVKRAEVGATVGLAIGGLAAGWLSWRVGHAWTGGVQPIHLALSPDNTQVHLAPDLGARVVLVSWAVAAVVVHGLLYALAWPSKPKPDQAGQPGAAPVDAVELPVAES